MLNNLDFSKRLRKVMEFDTISASGFADKIGVPRSSISHILSGRNKPSLDFILKIVDIYNDVDLDWLLYGNGNFPKSNSPTQSSIHPQKTISEISHPQKTEKKLVDFKSEEIIKSNLKESKIEKIVIFYKDGTFKEYFQRP